MQNRIDKLFIEKKENILSIFFTAGFPKLIDTISIIEDLDQAGADMIEIGIPFSDPVADGPVIQKSSQLALQNGMNLKLLFDQLKDLRKTTQMPVLLMGYFNSIQQFGIENFYKQCNDVGIDGIIIPDLPLDEYLEFHRSFSEKYNIHVVFLISSDTKPERIKLIDEKSRGFLYLVSSNSTTGTSNGISNEVVNRISELKKMNLKNPIVMGFGIKGQKEFSQACELVNGAIIGTAFVEVLEKSKDLKSDIKNFISIVKNKLVRS